MSRPSAPTLRSGTGCSGGNGFGPFCNGSAGTWPCPPQIAAHAELGCRQGVAHGTGAAGPVDSFDVPRPCAWQPPNQIRRAPSGGGRLSSNPSTIARGERTSSGSRPSHDGTRRTHRPDRRHATGSDQRTRDETPQSAESPGPGRLERSRRTLTSALSPWIAAVSSACSA